MALDPWHELKPPASDAITYLTFIETNLSSESLPRLHEVLQDQELNQAIGWDLVHLLLPLLPASESCLLDIAKLGNPREVVLKVSESLRVLALDLADEESLSSEGNGAVKPSATKDAQSAATEKAQTQHAEADLPLPILQFRILLSMLSVLHPRIKTKYPSRFLSGTLQAILATYGDMSSYHDEMTEDVVKFIKALSGTKRPVLPPRRSSSKVLLQGLNNAAALDPKATTDEVSVDEAAMQKKMLQSVITHLVEDYMLGLPSPDDIPGLAWSARLQEKIDPRHVVPEKPTFTEQMSTKPSLQNRSATLGSLVALAQDLDLDSQTLMEVIMDPQPELRGNEHSEDDPPAFPEDIPLSKTGSLLLLTARKAAEVFYDRPVDTPGISIFPKHEAIVRNFLRTDGKGGIGLQREALQDAVIFLGLLALNDNAIGEPACDEDFNEYLQDVSLLSSKSFSPSLRYQAHYLCTTVLRSHPHDLVRFSFILDTLEYCPYENLKASAVSWVKGETIEANPPQDAIPDSHVDKSPSIFATPIALARLSPFLFPDLTGSLITQSLQDSYMQLLSDLSFYLATLNFCYLLLRAKHLHEPLDIHGLLQNSDIGGRYLEPLKTAVARYRDALKEGGELYQGNMDTKADVDLVLLESTIERVEQGITALTKV